MSSEYFILLAASTGSNIFGSTLFNFLTFFFFVPNKDCSILEHTRRIRWDFHLIFRIKRMHLMFPHTDASNESWGLVGAVLLELLVVCFLSRDLVFIAGDLQQVWYGCWLWLLVSVGVYVYLVDLFHIWYSLSFFIIFHHVFHVLASAIVSFFHFTVSLSGLFVVWINLMKWNLTILNFVPRSQSFDLVNY